jgi:hypothetical protein
MKKFSVTTPPTNYPDFQESSLLSLYDKNNPDKNMFNLIDDEVIRLSGSRINLYKNEEQHDYDQVYMESKRKVISNIPIPLFGHYDPRVIEENMSQFGVEIQNDQVFIFNKSYVERVAGREIKIGDVLEPEFQNMKFEVYEVQEDSFESYGIYHLLVHAKLLRDYEVSRNETLLDVPPNTGGKL